MAAEENPTRSRREFDLEAVMDLSDIIASLQDLSVEELNLRGLAVDGTWDEVDDPVLLGPDGRPVDTWREGYPYDERLSRLEYERTKRLLQIELLKLQNWVKDTGLRLSSSSRAGTPPARAAPSNASWSTSTRAARRSSR